MHLGTIMINPNRLLDTSSSSASESEEENVMVLRRGKIYRTRQQYFEKYDDIEFFNRFRLTKPTVLALLQQIAPLISFPTNRYVRINSLDELFYYCNVKYSTGVVASNQQTSYWLH